MTSPFFRNGRFARLLGAVAQTALVLLVVSGISFMFLRLSPGDPVAIMLGSDYSRDSYDLLYRQLGLDLVEVYGWGTSCRATGASAT